MTDAEMSRQLEKAKRFYQLHHAGKLLILPNVWDCLGAILLESLGYPAIATASASVAFSNGYDDGENIPFSEVLTILRRLVKVVSLPVTADIESGYADHERDLRENIAALLKTGVVGINVEDSNKKTNSLLTPDAQCKKIRMIKEVAAEMNIPLFVNARTDVYIRGTEFVTDESKWKETMKRGERYQAAGADCFFPLGIRQEAQIKGIVEKLQMPVNILLIPGVPQLDILEGLGVARVSLGPGFLKIAVQSMRRLAAKLLRHEGLSEITSNEVTTDYLRKLIQKK